MSVAPLTEAIAHHQRGELDQAIQSYRRILTTEPNHADALHLLGVAALQRGQPRPAIQLIERAIASRPSVSAYHANLAEAYRAVGQPQRAIACCQLALRLQPDNADAAYTLASLLMPQGQTETAERLFRLAVEQRPDFALAHNGLGNACRVRGDFEQALKHFRRAAELNPHLSFVHTNLGQLLLERGELAEALNHCREAVRLEPQSTAAQNNLGNVLRRMGRLTEAKSCYIEALRLDPNLAMAHNNLGEILLAEGKSDEAERWISQAVQLDPQSARSHSNLATLAFERRDFVAAESHVVAARRLDPRQPDARLILARLRFDQGRIEDAGKEYRALLAERPDDPSLKCRLGEVFLELNQREEALACFRNALRVNPRCAPALGQLATHLRDKVPAEEFDALRRLLADPNLTEHERATLLFGLAQVCDARGQYEEAAQHLMQANDLEGTVRQQRGKNYSSDSHVAFVDRMIRVFTPEFFERVRGFGLDTERPVFIVGLPRSGTTLLEQVLGSHSRVYGAGELRFARDNFEALGGGENAHSESRAFDVLQVIDARTVQGLAKAHLDCLNALNNTADRIIDKMPDNYLYLGLLTALFPRARFLHCRRDLRDVAVSCWITHFREIPWANNPDQIASRFAQYCRLSEHWRTVLPVPMLEINYEDTVEDLEGVARRALDFLGLEWEPACLDFHRSQRAVRTASLSQVRQPIYRRSVARWRHYEKSLQPLFSRLP